MSSLSDLIEPALKKMGVSGQVRDAQIVDVFAEVVGPALAPMCRALRLERKALVISVANPALAHQLHIEAPRIIAGMNQRLGADLVSRLRFGS